MQKSRGEEKNDFFSIHFCNKTISNQLTMLAKPLSQTFDFLTKPTDFNRLVII